ncbi:MAG: cell envelope integrity protein CreD [Proteobacteria bacterium]|nr:cell envelope integrity protein CreD [Pseudomonadota bacterium]
MALIVLLTILMAVPLFFIQLALDEREGRAGEATQDIASGWGGTQTVTGPMLFVPYDVTSAEVVNGTQVWTTHRLTAVVMPKQLDIDAAADTGMRWRGIFGVPVYRSGLKMHAKFDRATIASFHPDSAKIHWNEAFVSVAVSDVRGLVGNVTLQVNGHNAAFQPGLGVQYSETGGIHAPLDLNAGSGDLDLNVAISLRGSRELSLSPLGEQTTAHIASAWPDPSFFGAFLPSDRRIDTKGFDAHWSVPYLARGFGQILSSDSLGKVFSMNFGVRFYQSVDFYQLVQRSLKYAVMFVGLAFLVFFIVELVAGTRLHAAHYAMIGAAQVLFYLLLLSFAEHLGFGIAYLLAMGGTIVMTCLYASSVLKSRLRAVILFAILSLLYSLLYVILIQEDYAMLVGSLLIFGALGTTMFVTRRLDWHQIMPVTPAV